MICIAPAACYFIASYMTFRPEPLRDRFNRSVTYLRISVTDLCNYRCFYCRPEEGVIPLPRKDILSFEEITYFVREAVALGFNKVRLTGGEPLVRPGIVDLVRMLSEIDGIQDLTMTTNGSYLSRYAADLYKYGIKRINVSLDSMDKTRFKEITRGGDLDEVLNGIETARRVGMRPIKLNCVVQHSATEPDALRVAEFAKANGYEARFITQMNLAEGEFSVVDGGVGGLCETCNRIRLSSDGYIQPCLFSEHKVSIKGIHPAEAIRRALEIKPEAGTFNSTREMVKIGG